ncbi:MAG: diaminopimelate decarboxylase [Sphingomonas sp.]|uniref:diaminopimelate decarboxylase n=1 Tax=Sphingomonas sp. TaxID=28214 RepID=UPI0017E9F90E|nr:diaminopimelate decarboxylase [Sphingomonas sp.]MBA3666386.1 diaminopimelate decarboxylase [Sphingomonas sp.]
MNHFELRDGVLHCEDVPLPLIAREVGTPVYVYSTAAMQRHARVFKSALASLRDPLVAFAVKANPNVAVLATLAAEGFGADVVSGGEYRRARAAGIPADQIVFSGVGKTADEMELALEGGLFQFNVESLAEAEMLSHVAVSMGRVAPISFRINPDVAAGSHAKISTGGAQDKFGINAADLIRAFEMARELPGLEAKGIAVHIGSQLTRLEPLEAAFTKLGELIVELRAAGHSITVADLGGGLGVPYDPAAPLPPSPADYAALVDRIAAGWGLRLVFEPGRLIVGNAGVLLTRVIRLKEGPKCPFVIVDAGMNDLMRPSLYDAWHGIEAVAPRGDNIVADIVGPVCESGDTFARARVISQVEPGDLMVIRTAGAYAATMGSTYNSRPLAAEVLVNGSEWAVVRERQDVEALIAGDIVPPWLPTGGRADGASRRGGT